MNLVLFEASEGDHGPVRLAASDRRTRHLREVLRAEPGRRLRCGVIDGALGTAELQAWHADGSTTLHLHLDAAPPPPPQDRLLLAVPRPKVLLRCLEHAAALGFGHIHLLRTWRVDKSHLGSSALHAPSMQQALRHGLEQARRTWLPQITVQPLFRPFVEDQLPALAAMATALVAHPEADTDLVDHAHAIGDGGAALLLAIGPERGFTAYEVDALRNAGCQPVRTGPHPLRVETALWFLAGVLHALRR